MEKFISEISQQEIAENENVSIASVRESVLQEVLKDFPNINKEGFISFSELDFYRQKYIQYILESNIGILSNVEKKVANQLKNDNSISTQHVLDNKDDLTTGQKLADKVAAFGGSWRFITIFGIFILIWMIINIIFLATKAFDPYPFILLNLILSCLAALQAPVIMMSQNRQEEKDRERAQKDYMINIKSEMEVRMLHEKIDHLIINHQQKLMEIQQIQIEMLNDIFLKINTPLKK